MSLVDRLIKIKSELPSGVTLVAVSKTKPESMIMEAYESNHLDFGENKVQELVQKHANLPKDIRWHFIGHLQTNKVKFMAPFVHLIHGVDSLKLLKTIDKEAQKNKRKIECLLQIKISPEETKYGLSANEARLLLASNALNELHHIHIAGVMGMASFVDDPGQIGKEFLGLKALFDDFKQHYLKDDPDFKVISMGMSDDYNLAIEKGGNMVRIGSSIFGERQYNNGFLLHRQE